MSFHDNIEKWLKKIIIENLKEEDLEDFYHLIKYKDLYSINIKKEINIYFSIYLIHRLHYNYEKYISLGGKPPSLEEYNEILINMNFYFELITNNIIENINKCEYEKLLKCIIDINKSVSIIQKAFRKYRYDPRFKFCKLVQTRNLLIDGCISREDFLDYINIIKK